MPAPNLMRKVGGFIAVFPLIAKFLLAQGLNWSLLTFVAQHDAFFVAVGLSIVAYSLVSQYWIVMLVLVLVYLLIEVLRFGGG